MAEAMMYGLTLSLKNEIVKVAPKGRVNCIAPGWVKTPMAEETLRDTAFVHRALATYATAHGHLVDHSPLLTWRAFVY